MPFFIRYYKNSIWAFLLSCFGSMMQSIGIVVFLIGIISGDSIGGCIEDGLSLLVPGSIMFVCGKAISRKKTFEKWLNENRATMDIDSLIRTDTGFAIAAFDKCPNIYCARYINALNPKAGAVVLEKAKPSRKKAAASAGETIKGGLLSALEEIVKSIITAIFVK